MIKTLVLPSSLPTFSNIHSCFRCSICYSMFQSLSLALSLALLFIILFTIKLSTMDLPWRTNPQPDHSLHWLRFLKCVANTINSTNALLSQLQRFSTAKNIVPAILDREVPFHLNIHQFQTLRQRSRIAKNPSTAAIRDWKHFLHVTEPQHSDRRPP